MKWSVKVVKRATMDVAYQRMVPKLIDLHSKMSKCLASLDEDLEESDSVAPISRTECTTSTIADQNPIPRAQDTSDFLISDTRRHKHIRPDYNKSDESTEAFSALKVSQRLYCTGDLDKDLQLTTFLW